MNRNLCLCLRAFPWDAAPKYLLSELHDLVLLDEIGVDLHA